MIEAVVLAAGKGTRMNSECPKVLHEILGQPILRYVLSNLAALGISRPKVVIGAGAGRVRKYLGTRADAVWQRRQRGTGHAVLMSQKLLRGYRGTVLILPGDMPLIRLETLRAFLREHRRSGAEASVLSCLRPQPSGYGRILRAAGRFYGIREELDATEAERAVQEVNTGVYAVKAVPLFWALARLRPSNEKKELYLTDIIEIFSKRDLNIEAFPLAMPEEGQGVNSREDLAVAVKYVSKREIERHQANGVTFVSPEQTFVAPGVKIGKDSVVYPWSYLERGVRIGAGCQIGPFAKIRTGTVIGDHSVVGSFVEVNRSSLGRGVMAKHLAYLGDARVGDGTNIGAGAVTANFDGRKKHRTHLGKKVFVGSNTVFVAPVALGDRAKTGAGAVVTRGTRVPAGAVVAGVPARPLKKKRP